MITNPFAHFYLRMPLYVGQWLRTKYMTKDKSNAPITFYRPDVTGSSSSAGHLVHPASRIIYTSLVCNSSMRRLTPVCYSAQMFGIEECDIPQDDIEKFPTADSRREFVSIAIPQPHIWQGRFIDDSDMMQLSAEDATRVNAILLEEMWNDIDDYWRAYRKQFSIDHPDRTPIYYDCLLDFCEQYNISVDAVDSMYRALKRRNKKLRESL